MKIVILHSLTIFGIPSLPPEATTIFIPVLYIFLFVVLLVGGFAAVLWRLFAWLRKRISEGVKHELRNGVKMELIDGVKGLIKDHEEGEQVWQQEIKEGQGVLSERIDAVHERIDRLLESRTS